MCIRDSVWIPDRMPKPSDEDAYTPAAARAVVYFASHTRGSVSYTHLRAHETVLDLVCRLLLEKKKLRTSNAHNQRLLDQQPTHEIYTSSYNTYNTTHKLISLTH